MGKAQAKIRTGQWDFVILQEFSNRPMIDPASTTKYMALFDAEIRRSGAETIIWQNWTRRGRPQDYAPMLATYRQVERATQATLAPIGAAWRECAMASPDIKLFAGGRHPTDAGTYLTACVL